MSQFSESPLLTALLSDTVLDKVFSWYTEQKNDTPACNDLEWKILKAQLQERLGSGEYSFSVQTRIRENGLIRDLWTDQDRIVLKALGLSLEPVLMPLISHRCFHSAGSDRSRETINKVQAHLTSNPDSWVLQGHIAGCLDHVDHHLLYVQLEDLIPGEKFILRLIWQYLHRVVYDGNDYLDVEKGISCDSPLSPLMAALYLRPLDEVMEQAGGLYVRFPELWLLTLPTRWQLQKVERQINTCLAGMGLPPQEMCISRNSKGFALPESHLLPAESSGPTKSSGTKAGTNACSAGQAFSAAPLSPAPPRWSQWARAGVGVLAGVSALGVLDHGEAWAACKELTGSGTGTFDLDGDSSTDITIVSNNGNCTCGPYSQNKCINSYSCNWNPADHHVEFANGAARTSAFSAVSANMTFNSAYNPILTANLNIPSGIQYLRVKTSNNYYGWLTVNNYQFSKFVGFSPRDNTVTPSTSCPAADADGTLTAAGGISEPVNLPTTAAVGSPVNVFDFTITDGATSDGLALGVTQIDLTLTGTASANFSKMRFNLSGCASKSAVVPIGSTVSFTSTGISVANGGNTTCTVQAYWANNTGIIDNQTLAITIDGDTDLTVDGAGTQMSGTNSAVTTGNMSTTVTATALAFTTQPAGSVSGFALTTQPVVKGQDAAGNTDTDFTETITLTEASAGSLSNNTQAAVAGVATFTNVIYTATADQQSFTLTANDQDGVGSDIPTVDANSVTSDVVATKLVYTTQPSPTTLISGQATAFSTVPVVAAQDANNTLDTGYSTDISLGEVNGAGSATMSVTGDTDGSAATVTLTPSSGTATFSALSLTYTNAGSSNEAFNLRAGSGGLTTADSSVLTATTPPTVSSIVRQIPSAATTNADSVVFRVTFSENVQNVDVTDFALSGTAAGDGTVSGVTAQSTSVYDVTVSGLTSSNGTVNLDVDSGQDITGQESTPLASTTPTGSDETYTLDNTAPTVSDGFISISGASGTGGAFKVGDTVTASWNNTGTGDNNSDVAGVTMDFSQFGGGAAVSASNSSGTWTATYTIAEGAIDATNRNVSVTATDTAGNSATTADTSNATVDSQSPGTPTGTLAVDENSTNGSAVGTVSGGGDDGVSYSLTDTANGRFAINSGGAVTVADSSQLDYESNTSHNITVRATDNAGNTTDAVVSVTINNVDDVAPTFTNLNGDTVTFGIGGNAVTLDNGGDAIVSDVDSTDFSGGNVTASVTTNAQTAEDVLKVGTVGNISTSGATVNHSDGFTIGSSTGGSSGTDLVVTLNANATVARVQDLIRALQYLNSNASTVNTLVRTVRITTNDGSQTSANQDVTVSLVRAPLIDLDGDDSSGATNGGYNGSFTEDGGAVAVTDTDTSITDDGSFKALTVTLTNSPDGAAESLASIEGTGALTVNGEAVTIDPYNSGSGILSITVDDGSATAATMETLMESIRYNNSSDTPDLTNRSISFSATDNSDETGPTVNAVIAMNSANDPPVLDNNTGFTVLEGGQHTLTNTELQFTDPDNSAAEISYTVGSAAGSGQLEFAAAPGVVITSFTQNDIDTGKVNFVNAGGEATTDSFTVNVSDGAGGSVNGTTVNISVTPVDDPPTISGTPATTASHGDNYSFVPTANDAEGDGLSFSINNKPSWATFDTATGTLSGIPGSANVGTTTTGIDISVTANGKSDSLAAFDLTVTNSAPVFTGTPTITGTAKVEQILGLTETATTDPDGDSVTLSYQWAADSIDILGAVSAVYTVTEEEKGKNLTCTLTAEDGLGGSTDFTTAGVKVKSFNWMIFYRAFIPGKGYVNIEPQQSSSSSEENNQ